MFRTKWFDFPMILGASIAAFIWWRSDGNHELWGAGFAVCIAAAIVGVVLNGLFG